MISGIRQQMTIKIEQIKDQLSHEVLLKHLHQACHTDMTY